MDAKTQTGRVYLEAHGLPDPRERPSEDLVQHATSGDSP